MVLLITGIKPLLSLSPSTLSSDTHFSLILAPLLYLLSSLSSNTYFSIDLMEEHTIYFAWGFKSFDVSKTPGTQGDLYEWTERSRNYITRTNFTKRTMIWLIQRLKEASLVKGNSVRRWRRRESFSEMVISMMMSHIGLGQHC